MKHIVMAMMIMLVAAWVEPMPAQSFLSKKSKVNPTQRVPELILTVKTERDERKRAHAATELREYDTTTFNEIIPVLVDVLMTDRSVNVRTEALISLTRIRPVSQLAGHAIEKAAAEDESMRIRLQAKTALPKYHLAGYSRKMEAALAKKKQTDEPPVGAAPPASVKVAAPLPKFDPLPLGPSPPRPFPTNVARPTTPVEGPALFPK